MEHLSSRDVVYLAEIELGDYVAGDAVALDAATAVTTATDGDRDRFPGMHLKVAALFHGLLTRRPFPRGNARVALLSAVVFLALNGMDVAADDDDLVELTRVAARDDASILTIAAAFEAVSVRMPVGDLQGV